MNGFKRGQFVALSHFGRVVAQGEIVHERARKGGFVVRDFKTGELVTRYPADSMRVRSLNQASVDYLRGRTA